jgi:hypothetical protein
MSPDHTSPKTMQSESFLLNLDLQLLMTRLLLPSSYLIISYHTLQLRTSNLHCSRQQIISHLMSNTAFSTHLPHVRGRSSIMRW